MGLQVIVTLSTFYSVISTKAAEKVPTWQRFQRWAETFQTW